MPEGEYLQYGGQAIIEGVMMRSPRYFSVACRAPNGDIVQETEALEKTWIGRQKWLKFPFLRGSLALLDAMALGIKAMRFASTVQMDEAYQPPVENQPTAEEGDYSKPGHVDYPRQKPPKGPSKRVQDIAIGATIVTSLALGFFIFNYLPNLLSENLSRGGTDGRTINFVTEIIKTVIFIGYIWAIGQMKDIQEVFKYHGAEHKAINTMEAGQELTLENCRLQTRLHPRCGTSFAIVVLLVSMVIFTFVPRYPYGHPTNYLQDVTTRFFIELLVLPIISGIAYELIRIAGKFRNQGFVRALFWPGLMSQYLTTREPRDDQIEVALKSLQACIDAEEGKVPAEKPQVDKDEEPAQIA